MSANPEIARAVECLRAGGLVAFPTETVYGLGADATNPDAMAKLYQVKGRPAWHPVIVHLADAGLLHGFGRSLPEYADRLADAFWPGPLTLIVKRRLGAVCDAVAGGMDTVGLRVPNQLVAHALLDAFGGGIAAPSANRFGRVSPTIADDVRADLGDDVEEVLDGGPCAVGVESTIVDCTGEQARVLRLGGVTVAQLAAVLGYLPEVVARDTSADDDNEGVRAPGTIASHYAPHARVELHEAIAVAARANALIAERTSVGVLALADADLGALPTGAVVLEAPTTIEEYARVLYQRLRDADRNELGVLLVVPPPNDGIGSAVNDRLRRAAASA